MTPWVILGAVVGAGAVVAAVYAAGYAAGHDAVQADEKDRALQIERAATAGAARAAAAAASAVQVAVSRIRIEQRTIRTEVEREIVEKPVYRDCVHPLGIVQRINAALGAEPAGPAGAAAVPGVLPASAPAR